MGSSIQYPYPTSPPPARALYLQHIPPPLHQLHPQRRAIKPRVLDDLDRARNPGVAVLVRLAVRLHLLQRLPQRLAGRGGVAVLEVLVVAEDEAGGVGGDFEGEVGPR